MFRFRQSSLAGRGNEMSPKIAPCMQCGPGSDASRTPSHGMAGRGSFQRCSPVGGAANGMPLKMRILPSALVVPLTSPPVVLTCAAAAALILIVITTANVAVRSGCLVIVFLA